MGLRKKISKKAFTTDGKDIAPITDVADRVESIHEPEPTPEPSQRDTEFGEDYNGEHERECTSDEEEALADLMDEEYISHETEAPIEQLRQISPSRRSGMRTRISINDSDLDQTPSRPKRNSRKANASKTLRRRMEEKRFQEARIPTTNRSILLYKPSNMLTLDKELAENYRTFLTEVTNLSIKDLEGFETFEIDGTGYCRELGNKFGHHYMDGKIAVIAPEQEHIISYHNNCSFITDLMKELFRFGREMVEDITKKEPLYAQLDTNLDNFIMDPSSKSKLEIKATFDTPSSSVRRMQKAKKKLDDLLVKSVHANSQKQKGTLLSDDALNDILGEIKSLKQTYENIDEISTPDIFPLKVSGENFHLSTETVDLYCIQSRKDLVFVYFKKNKEDIDTPLPNLINGEDTNVLLNKLLDLELIEFNAYMVKNKLHRIAAQTLGDLSGANALIGLSEHMNTGSADLGKEAKKYMKVYEDLKNGADPITYFNSLNWKTKIDLVKPTKHYALVNTLISKSNKKDVFRMYRYNEEDFMDYFQNTSHKKRGEILETIMDKTVYEDYHNTFINDWLKTNYTKLCERKGVKFKEKE